MSVCLWSKSHGRSKKEINIVHIAAGGNRARGGVGRLLFYLIPNLRQMDAHICCNIIDTYGPGAFYLMPFWFLISVLQFTFLIVTGRVDIAHIHIASHGSVLRKLLLLIIARIFRKPVVLHLHGADFDDFVDSMPKLQKSILIYIMLKSCRIVVLGKYWQEYVVESMHIPESKVTVIHNGVPDPDARIGERSLLIDVMSGGVQILFLGELSDRKGFPELVEAFSDPEIRNMSWKAVIAGDGEVEEQRKLIKSRGLEQHVQFLGWVSIDQAWELHMSSQIFCLPSRKEGLPIAILEAMACGRAIVTTPVGAITDAIENRVTGLLVPPGKADNLCAALKILIQDAGLRSCLGKNARRHFIREFTITNMAEKIIMLYRGIEARGR